MNKKERKTKHYLKNKEAILEERREYYKENKEYILKRQRKYFKDWYKENKLDIAGARRYGISLDEYRNNRDNPPNKKPNIKKPIEIKKRKTKKYKIILGTTPIDQSCKFD